MDHGGPADVRRILHHIAGVAGDAVQILTVMYHDAADPLAVLQSVPAGQKDLPHAAVQLLHGMASAIPEVEITGQVHGLGSRCPLPVVPAVLRAVEAEEHMPVGKLLECLSVLQNALSGIFQIPHTLLQITPEGDEAAVIFQNFQIHMRHPFKKSWVGTRGVYMYCTRI